MNDTDTASDAGIGKKRDHKKKKVYDSANISPGTPADTGTTQKKGEAGLKDFHKYTCCNAVFESVSFG